MADGAPLGAPVVLETREKALTHVLVGDFDVVELKSGLGSLSIEERAKFVSAKLKDLANSDTPVSAITLHHDGREYKVMNGDQALMVVTTAEAVPTRLIEEIEKLEGVVSVSSVEAR